MTVVATAIVVAVAHAGSGSAAGGIARVEQVAGPIQQDRRYPGAILLPAGLPKPALTLTDTSGHSFDLAARTAGRVTLVYFGYTHCPDVCPTNMALAALSLARMPASEARLVDVVFVSTDPDRDTPGVIRSWLDAFSPRFVGLTGSIDQVHAAESAVGMTVSYAEAGPGGYSIVHAAYTLVYSQDNVAHLKVDGAATPAQYATTLDHLVAKGFQP